MSRFSTSGVPMMSKTTEGSKYPPPSSSTVCKTTQNSKGSPAGSSAVSKTIQSFKCPPTSSSTINKTTQSLRCPPTNSTTVSKTSQSSRSPPTSYPTVNKTSTDLKNANSARPTLNPSGTRSSSSVQSDKATRSVSTSMIKLPSNTTRPPPAPTRTTSSKSFPAKTMSPQAPSKATNTSTTSNQNQSVHVNVNVNLDQLAQAMQKLNAPTSSQKSSQNMTQQLLNQSIPIPPQHVTQLSSISGPSIPASNSPPPQSLDREPEQGYHDQYHEGRSGGTTQRGFRNDRVESTAWDQGAMTALSRNRNTVETGTMHSELGVRANNRSSSSGWSSLGGMFGMTSEAHFPWDFSSIHGNRVFTEREAYDLMSRSVNQAEYLYSRGLNWLRITSRMLETRRLVAIPMRQPWLTCNQVHISGLTVIGGHMWWTKESTRYDLFAFRLHSITADGIITFFSVNTTMLEEGYGQPLSRAGIPIDHAVLWIEPYHGYTIPERGHCERDAFS